jgi:hypothetical protein
MTSRSQAQCTPSCAHYRSFLTTGLPGPSCTAFPAGIPDEIWENKADHRKPVAGDHGVQWTSKNGAEFPEYALFAD